MADTPSSAAPTFARPPLFLRAILCASCLFALLPVAYSVHYGRVWWKERRGVSLQEQRLQYTNTPWFQPYFQAFCIWFNQTVPEEDGVLLTPSVLELETGRGRWYLFLNYFVYPRRVYVRKPHLASGTLVDYPRWLRHHFNDRPRRMASEDLGTRITRQRQEQRQLEEFDVQWKLEYPVSRVFLPERLVLSRLVDGEWEVVPIPSRQRLIDLAGFQRGSGEARSGAREAGEDGG